MHCQKCNAVAAEQHRFCEECGSALRPVGSRAPATANAAADAGSGASPCPGSGSGPGPGTPQSVVGADLAMVCDIGRRYPVNQDAGMVGPGQAGAFVMLVADGVSSADRADAASAAAVQSACQSLGEAAADTAGGEAVLRAIADAHQAVLALPYTNKEMEEPETTIVAALVRGAQATIGWVGDSRAYLVKDASAAAALSVALLTRDDSWLADALDDNRIDRAAALADRRAHAITQCLGMRDQTPRINLCETTLAPGERLLLCSDGLWNYFDDPAALARAIGSAPADADAMALCRHLVGLANAAGGRDNITVAVYRRAA